MKNVVIYGRGNCSYCTRAKELAAELQSQGKLDFEYVDIDVAGIDGAKLSELVGKPVKKIPQILIDGQPIGGYAEFAGSL